MGGVSTRVVPLAKALHQGFWGENGHGGIVWAGKFVGVTLRRPKQERAVPHQVTGSVDGDENSVGERAEFRFICYLLPSAINAGGVQLGIDLLGQKSFGLVANGALGPGCPESVITLAAAFGAGP